jgi:DNA-binding SARP family transcriptional activator
MELTLFLLGETEVRIDGKLLKDLSAEKACALLFFLVVESHHAHRRDALAEMFWPEKPQGYGRNNLKQTL